MSGAANHHHHHHAWSTPSHSRRHDSNGHPVSAARVTSGLLSRSRTPTKVMDRMGVAVGGTQPEGETGGDDDPRTAAFRELFARSETRIASLFQEKDPSHVTDDARRPDQARDQPGPVDGALPNNQAPKKAARVIDEDDYDDDEDETMADDASPLQTKSTGIGILPASKISSPPKPQQPSPVKITSEARRDTSSNAPGKTSEQVRKELEEDKKAAEDAAKRSFHTMFYTLENDRDAMLEQQRLEELDRQLDAEMGNGAQANHAGNAAPGTEQQGKLSSANLGASSLTLKHLIARIDAKREQVRASDAELRNLMSEVRKNRSKWASEDRVGQEELYEAAEKVLSELKAMTTHSTAFLTKVGKKDAPDYHVVIKHPMDLGTMTKRLKSLHYKSKADFVNDLNLIWANCLKYNAEPNHFLRKHALAMRKETDKLVPLIPDIVIRDRAEVEAEERRLQGGVDGELDGGEESDDEPIMSSRGRKAPGKKTKKGAATPARKAPSAGEETPGADVKPTLEKSGSVSNLKGEFTRAGSDAPLDGSQNGTATPPIGSTVNGIHASGTQSDAMEIDGFASSTHGLGLSQGAAGLSEEPEHDDLEYKTWKQVTKKDRALVAAERNRLFAGDKLNAEEPALVRTKAGMRRWLKNQRLAMADGAAGDGKTMEEVKEDQDAAKGGETLAEGMEGEEEERVLPDYYDTLAAIPEIPERLRWMEDAEGHLVDASEDFLRVVPPHQFTAPESTLSKKMEANMRQMQETRKICSKIGVIKQMQLQSQMYQNQFQKYNPEPFVEQDVDAVVLSDEGPVMAPWVCRAALQRSVGKICYHAGFEEFQPSALNALTDIASDFFAKLVQTLGVFHEAPKVPVPASASDKADGETKWKSRYTAEEKILHCLHENGLDVEGLESYVKDDVERLGSKLGVMHERMKAHLADLLRPALTDAGPDGSRAFNDGSEQFVGGDFAEDIDEDFFGFKELGLDREFSLSSLSVPLHLLQNRMHNAYAAQSGPILPTTASQLDPPPPYEPVTLESLKRQIGLVQNFFLAKLHANSDEALVEDEDLPPKQRFPKPRLPPSGKISSPRKRPLKEVGGHGSATKSNKKKKLDGPNFTPAEGVGLGVGVKGKLKFSLPKESGVTKGKDGPDKDGAKDDSGGGGGGGGGIDGVGPGADGRDGPGGAVGGMMSPESIVAA